MKKIKYILLIAAIITPLFSVLAADSGMRPFDLNLVNETANSSGYVTQNVTETTLATLLGYFVSGFL